VFGLDLTPEMLARAVASVPEARFVEADLRRIPGPDASVGRC
jgi:trans-aconitate methyltransferase